MNYAWLEAFFKEEYFGGYFPKLILCDEVLGRVDDLSYLAGHRSSNMLEPDMTLGSKL